MRYRSSIFTILLATWSAAGLAQQQGVTGIDFADDPGKLYVPVRSLAKALNVDLGGTEDKLKLDGKAIPDTRELWDGTHLVSLDTLKGLGAKIGWDNISNAATVDFDSKTCLVRRGDKKAEVNKAVQQLRAYQGDVLILETHVSTGRRGHGTPSGSFSAYHKERMHHSHLYNDAPMPWAVEIDGNVFIHGYPSVPRRPASHGCIRMPLRGKNAARYFYRWVTLGTPVKVGNEWSDSTPSANNLAGSTQSVRK
jgi:hypothetical protein